MDTSNRLDFLLGDLRVEESEVTAEEWATVVMSIISHLSLSLPHLGFSDLEGQANLNTGNGSFNGFNYTTDMSLVEWPVGFSPKTRVVPISFLDTFEREVSQDGTHSIRLLYLAHEGKLLKFEGVYRRNPSEQSDKRHKDLLCVSGEFSIVTESVFAEMVVAHPGLINDFFSNVLSSIGNAISRKKSWLSQLQRNESYIERIGSRVKFS